MANVPRDLGDGFPTLHWAMLLFVLLASFTVLHVLIGVLCDVVIATAASEEEKQLESEVLEAQEGAPSQI